MDLSTTGSSLDTARSCSCGGSPRAGRAPCGGRSGRSWLQGCCKMSVAATIAFRLQRTFLWVAGVLCMACGSLGGVGGRQRGRHTLQKNTPCTAGRKFQSGPALPPQHGGARNSQEMGLTVKVKGWLGSLRERRGATILRALALSAGAFLVVTGVIGLSAIAFGELVYFVGSIYTIIFGLTALVVEVKHKLPLVGIAYEWIDTYLKFLTVQRGKGVRRVPIAT